MTSVRLTGVTLRRSGRTVLAGVDLSLPAHGFVGVLGANGAGKTTLFRAILGLLPPDSGTIEVLGAPAARGNPRIGYMPQTRTPGDLRLRGRDVVAAAASARWGLPLASRAERRDVDHALALVGATALARRSLGELSGGERQRLLLAQALLGQPRLLLLDEPLISLDPTHQAAVIDLVAGLQRELGILVLFSAHELNPLLGALDLVLYLGGCHAALGSVDQVVTGPVLSRLYGAPVEVVRAGGRIFVVSGASDLEREHRCRHHA